ncbi:putative ankyrin repeat and SOCS box protein 15 isoform X1 [Apostichopus japonicus]|uniref:Putative ankyrin repeat and SOCS box protein 15 isoform X1 n=1 Tax=Stichopus japonicus TaxID=307972 RepID=A0A2G8K5U5_STIJA|nr:putative ankyrin repeat and SOCS box protein 15 isoform X1 [Apostichopus japonicus]
MLNLFRLLFGNARQEKCWSELHVAVIQNDVTSVRNIVATNGSASMQEKTPQGDTALLLAAKFGCNEALCVLLELGADPNQPRSALIDLIKSGKNISSVSIEKLVESGANLDAICGTFGLNPLGWCAKTGNVTVLKQLLMHGGAPWTNSSQRQRDTDPYFIAARHGHFECLKLLLFYEDPDAMSFCPCGASVVLHETPLCFASREGHEWCVDFLLSCGANPDTKRPTVQNASPLLLAASRGHLSIVKRLEPLTQTRKFYDGTRKSILHIAAENGHLDIVKFAVEAGYDPNTETAPGTRTRAFFRLLERVASPLYLAVSAGHTEIVKYLLKNGASMQDHGMLQCPLWQAFPNLEMMATAFDHGATICNCQREKMFTTQKFQLLAIKFLLDRGLDPEFKCEYSPFGFCVWQIYPANKEQCHSLLTLLRLWSSYWSKPLICRHLKQSLRLCKSTSLINEVLCEVPSLQHLSRVSIRRSLGQERLSCALCFDELPLPTTLRDFVQCTNVEVEMD